MRSVLLPVLATATLSVVSPTAASAQTLARLTASPDSTAALFLRSVRAIRWRTAAQFMHESTLARFRDVVGYMVETDSTGGLRERFTGAKSPQAFRDLPPAVVFDRAVGRMVDDMPGFMHSLFDHDDHIIGHVMEGADSAHVVYRTQERLQGARPEVRVVQLARTPDGWRVLWSDELEVLDAALDGIPRSRHPPPSHPHPPARAGH